MQLSNAFKLTILVSHLLRMLSSTFMLSFLHTLSLPLPLISQLAVSSALTRLGYSPRLEVPIFDGVVTTDIVIEMNMSGGGKERVSIEFDGPSII
jgi:hypothetical protein